MTSNDLPSWVPIFNLVASLTALGLVVPILRVLNWSVVYRVALAVALVILVAGALFQANILPLWVWVIVGAGGRGTVLALIVVGLVIVRPSRRPRVSLDDIAAQLANIQRVTLNAANSAERAHDAASVVGDRALSQEERAAGDRERAVRIEGALAENTDITKLAAEHADNAYREANSVNEKIASQGAVLVSQGKNAVEDRARGVRIEDVSTDTNKRAIDIQERLP